MPTFVITAIPFRRVVGDNLSVIHTNWIRRIMEITIVDVQSGVTDSNDNASAVDTSVKEGPSLLNIALYHPVNIGSVQSLFLPPLPVTAVLWKPKALGLVMLIFNLR